MNLIKRIGSWIAWKLAEHRGWVAVVRRYDGMLHHMSEDTFTVGVKSGSRPLSELTPIIKGAVAEMGERDWLREGRTEHDRRTLYLTLKRVAEPLHWHTNPEAWKASFVGGEWFLFRTAAVK